MFENESKTASTKVITKLVQDYADLRSAHFSLRTAFDEIYASNRHLMKATKAIKRMASPFPAISHDKCLLEAGLLESPTWSAETPWSFSHKEMKPVPLPNATCSGPHSPFTPPPVVPPSPPFPEPAVTPPPKGEPEERQEGTHPPADADNVMNAIAEALDRTGTATEHFWAFTKKLGDHEVLVATYVLKKPEQQSPSESSPVKGSKGEESHPTRVETPGDLGAVQSTILSQKLNPETLPTDGSQNPPQEMSSSADSPPYEVSYALLVRVSTDGVRGFYAFVLNLPEVVGHGSTKEYAVTQAQNLAFFVISDHLAKNLPVPWVAIDPDSYPSQESMEWILVPVSEPPASFTPTDSASPSPSRPTLHSVLLHITNTTPGVFKATDLNFSGRCNYGPTVERVIAYATNDLVRIIKWYRDTDRSLPWQRPISPDAYPKDGVLHLILIPDPEPSATSKRDEPQESPKETSPSTESPEPVVSTDPSSPPSERETLTVDVIVGAPESAQPDRSWDDFPPRPRVRVIYDILLHTDCDINGEFVSSGINIQGVKGRGMTMDAAIDAAKRSARERIRELHDGDSSPPWISRIKMKAPATGQLQWVEVIV